MNRPETHIPIIKDTDPLSLSLGYQLAIWLKSKAYFVIPNSSPEAIQTLSSLEYKITDSTRQSDTRSQQCLLISIFHKHTQDPFICLECKEHTET